MIIRAAMDGLARLLGVERGLAEEVLHSEASAREQVRLSRRGLFLGVGAVAAGSAFSFPHVETDAERVMRMAHRILSEYFEGMVGVQSFGVNAAGLDLEKRTLNVSVWVRPFGYIEQPIEAELGLK